MSWKKVRLGDVCRIEKGNIGITKAIAGEFPLVVLGEERKSHNEYQFDDEAVVVPLVSSTGHGDRSMKRIHYQSGKFSIGSILCAVIVRNKSELSTEFLYRYLDLNKEKELVSRMKGMANVSLSINSIADVEIPIPPIDIQKSIISKLNSIENSNFSISNEFNYQLDLLKKLRQQILQDAIQGKLIPQDPKDEPASKLLERIKAEKEQLISEKKIKKEKPLPKFQPEEIPFEIPESWVWCRLGELVLSYQNGISKRNASIGNKVIVLRLADIINSKISLNHTREIRLTEEEFENYKLQNDDILVTRVNGSIDIVGSFTLVNTDEVKFTVCDHLIRMRLWNNSILSKFIHCIGRSKHLRIAVENNFKTTSGQKTINQGHLDKLLIPFPPLDEQFRIVTKIEQLMKLCDELEQTIHLNQNYTRQLLQVSLIEALEPKAKN